MEREIDLALDAGEKRPKIAWHFPVRVLDPIDGDMRLLNRGEMETRRDAWLELAKIPHEACGSWYFTWNAFQINCDAQSILPTLEALYERPDEISEGASFRHPAASEAGQLSLDTSDPTGRTFIVRMPLDPDKTYREKAQSDVVVGEVTGEPVSFEDALADRSKERVSGTVEVAYEVDPAGRVVRRSTLIELETTPIDGTVESTTTTEIVERTLVSSGS